MFDDYESTTISKNVMNLEYDCLKKWIRSGNICFQKIPVHNLEQITFPKLINLTLAVLKTMEYALTAWHYRSIHSQYLLNGVDDLLIRPLGDGIQCQVVSSNGLFFQEKMDWTIEEKPCSNVKYQLHLRALENKKHLTCPRTLFTCRDNTCILDYHICDGVSDCPDSSDESNCSGKVYKMMLYDCIVNNTYIDSYRRHQGSINRLV